MTQAKGIKFEALTPQTYREAQKCVHCGLCLPVCPTYLENGLETDSPRGRIHLMRALSDGRIEATDSVVKHLDLCLDCRACEGACPSTVVYHRLIEETRERLVPLRRTTWRQRLLRRVILSVLPRPGRMKLAMLPVRMARRVGLGGVVSGVAQSVGGESMVRLVKMVPEGGPLWAGGLGGEMFAAAGERKKIVGMLATCVGSVMQEPVNRKTVEVLTHLGCEVRVPRSQQCCGAIHHHQGEAETAKALARRNIAALEACEVIITNVAGCGAMLRDYGHLLRDDPQWAKRAAEFTAKVRDVHELIVDLDPPDPPHRVEKTVAYHEACHLVHGQRVSSAPRKLLGMIAGLKVVPLVEAEVCCGAAGTYSLTEPQMSGELASRKLGRVLDSGAEALVSANIGCTLQISTTAAGRGVKLPIFHPVELLHEAYLGGK
jgi:glycolate oxidase iron-sulfur subunit